MIALVAVMLAGLAGWASVVAFSGSTIGTVWMLLAVGSLVSASALTTLLVNRFAAVPLCAASFAVVIFWPCFTDDDALWLFAWLFFTVIAAGVAAASWSVTLAVLKVMRR